MWSTSSGDLNPTADPSNTYCSLQWTTGGLRPPKEKPVSQIFAQLKIPHIVIDPKTREPVGKDVREINKSFCTQTQSLDDVRAWAQENKASSCALIFETPED